MVIVENPGRCHFHQHSQVEFSHPHILVKTVFKLLWWCPQTHSQENASGKADWGAIDDCSNGTGVYSWLTMLGINHSLPWAALRFEITNAGDLLQPSLGWVV